MCVYNIVYSLLTNCVLLCIIVYNMRINISLPDDLHDRITQHCVKKGWKLSSLIASKLSEELSDIPPGKIIDPGFPDLEDQSDNELLTAIDQTPTRTLELIKEYLNTAPQQILKQAKEQVEHLGIEETRESLYGICPTCFVKKPKPVELVTYLDEDLTATEGKLCAECIKKCVASGKLKHYGGVVDF